MKTMNFLKKLSLLTVIFITTVNMSFATSTNDDTCDDKTTTEKIINRITQEIKTKVRLSEAAKEIKQASVVVVKLTVSSEGKINIEQSSANNSEFEDYVVNKLKDIDVSLPEEYVGKKLVYRFSLI